MIAIQTTKKRFSAEQKIKLFFGLLVLFLIIFAIAQPAHAWDADGIVGATGVGLKDIFTFVAGMCIWVAGSIVALVLTSSILQWVINNQTTFVNFDHSEFVQHGLVVTQGLADMLLLLIFVVSAFGIIFKYKDFEAKKTLTKLVIVAIMTRFGVLLVKMMTDIGNVCINTIMANNGNILTNTVSRLISDALISTAVSMGSLAIVMAAFAVPVLNLGAALVTIGTIGTTAAYLVGIGAGNPLVSIPAQATLWLVVNFIAKGVFSIFAMTTLSGLFLTYIILFVSRLFMLQILAVMAPLAIMAYALPTTQHWFKQWWNSLVSWTFVGVYTLFFLVLGLGSTAFIPTDATASSILSIKGLEGLHLDGAMFYYGFLIVYLSLVQSMANKDKVAGEMFRSAMVGVGGAAYAHMISPALTRVQDAAVVQYGDAKARMGTKQQRFFDPLLMHGSGVVANAANDETASGIRGMFSGDIGKTSDIARNAAKTWRKPSDASDLVDSKINEIGKDLTMEKAFGKKSLNGLQLQSLLRKYVGNKDEADNLKAVIENNPSASAVFDSMLRDNKFTPTQNKFALANELFGESKTELLKEKIISQGYRDEKLRKAALSNVKNLINGDDAESQSKLAWAISNKDIASKKSSMESASAKLFGGGKDNDNKLLALLSIGDQRILGTASKVDADHGDTSYYDKLAELIGKDENFKALAKANPTLVRQIAGNPHNRKLLPRDLQIHGDAAHPENITGIDMNELDRIIQAGTG
jgi:hypothetical protein